jgi:iron complex transport system substrate-binding protein
VKILSLFVCLSLVVAMFTGCNAGFKAGTYYDDVNHAVELDAIPERIVSFGPSITEILFALGLGQKIVGVSNYCDYPEEAKLVPTVGDAFNPSLEKIVELQPDLVLTVKQEQLTAHLDDVGINYAVIDPHNIDDIKKDIKLLGDITGTTKTATELIKNMDNSVARITGLVKNAPKVSVFFMIDATDPTLPWTAGTGSFIDSLITMAGGTNVAGGAEGDWIQLSLEKIVQADPDIIITQTMTGGQPIISIEELEHHPIWSQMRAVKAGNVFVINGDIVSRPAPRIVQGLEEMAKLIHPEVFDK